jgi:hypothetical protein
VALIKSESIQAFIVDHTGTEIDLQSRVNAVETMYAAFPALMYINSSIGARLLEPLFQLQPLRNSTNGYAAADLGVSRVSMNVGIWYSDHLL